MKQFIDVTIMMILLFVSSVSSSSASTQVRVGVYHIEPLIFRDSNMAPRGFWIDILEQIAVEEKWEIEYVPGTWIECLNRLEAGEIDLLLNIAYSKERAAKYDFNKEPVLYNWLEVYVQPGSNIQSVIDLNGKRVAVFRESHSEYLFADMVKGFGIHTTVLEATDYANVFELLDNKTADAGIINHLFGMVRHHHYDVEKTNIVFGSFQSHFATPKNGRKELLHAIDRHLMELKTNKTSFYYQTFDKWFGGVSIKEKMPLWAKLALASFLLVTAIFLLFTFLLKKQVKIKTAALLTANDNLQSENKERRKAEGELRKSEELYRHLFENHSAVKLMIEPETGNIIDANDAAASYYGWSRERLRQMRIQEINTLSPEEVGREMEKARTRKRIHFEFRHRRADGSVRDVEVFSSKIEVEGKDILHSIVQDITERKQAEEALIESERRIRNLFEQASEGIFIITSDHRYVDANEAGLKMLGYSREELLRLHVPEVLVEGERSRLDVEVPVMMAGTPHLAEWLHLRKDGTTFPAEVSARLISGNEYFAIVRDLTARKRAEEALIASEMRFRELLENVQLIAVLLQAGFEVLEAASGEEALSLVDRNPDLIILDVKLPDIDGFEVCRRIKSNPATSLIPILHLSATYQDSESRVKGLEGGADSYLTHPVEPLVLIATIRALLRIREGEVEREKLID